MASLARRRSGKLFLPVTLGRFSTAAPREEVESDVIVIGGGHVGSAAAIKAGRMGLKTICIEKRGLLGRIFPYNALLGFCEPKHALGANLSMAIALKEKTTRSLSKSIEGLLKTNGVKCIKGTGRFVSPTEVSVGDIVLKGKKIVIATGSNLESAFRKNIVIDGKKIISSITALSLREIPRRAVVIGANCSGLEIGAVWGHFGTKMIVVDVAAYIIPTMDVEIRENLQSKLANQNIEFMLETRVVGVDTSTSSGVRVIIEPAAGGEQRILETDIVLVPGRRVPNTRELNLEKIGITNDYARMTGGIEVINRRFSSIVRGVYAIGDVAARKAAVDGAGYMDLIITGLGEDLVDFEKVSDILYTHPEVASIGMTEEQVKAIGNVEYRADRNTLDGEGLIKVIAEKNTNKMLGAHLMSPNAETKIRHAVFAMHEWDADAEDVMRLLSLQCNYGSRQLFSTPERYLMKKIGSSPSCKVPINALASALSCATPDQQKMILGEQHPMVELIEPEPASKITGLLLETEQNDVHLLESPDMLQKKVVEAEEVIQDVAVPLGSLPLNG